MTYGICHLSVILAGRESVGETTGSGEDKLEETDGAGCRQVRQTRPCFLFLSDTRQGPLQGV